MTNNNRLLITAAACLLLVAIAPGASAQNACPSGIGCEEYEGWANCMTFNLGNEVAERINPNNLPPDLEPSNDPAGYSACPLP